MQVLDPLELAYSPGAQSVHVALPLNDAYLPKGHGAHAV